MDFKQPKTIVATLIAVLVIIVVLQNTASVQTSILFFSFTMPRAVLLLATGAIGYGLGVFMTARKQKKQQADESPNAEDGAS
jgi:uncharacterized integral membrane protein